MKRVLKLFILTLCLSLYGTAYGKQFESENLQPIAEWPSKIQPLTIGSHIPNVTLWTGNGDWVHLAKLVYKRPTVIIFYQGSWSPACTDQLENIKDNAKKLKGLGYNIIAISPDSPHKLIKSRKKRRLNYLLLSDYHLEASRAFGLAYRLTNKEAKRYKKKYGAELRHVKGEEQYNLPVPGIFIVDTTGQIHFQYVNPDLETQLSSGMLLEAAKMVAKSITQTKKSS